MAGTNLTPAERAAYFAQTTRQYKQMLPSLAGAELSTIQFKLPNARLVSTVRLMVEAVVNVKHATNTTYTPEPFAPFNLLRRVSVDLNNGFSPFSLAGRDLYFYNLIRHNSTIYQRQSIGRGKVVQGLTASAAGADNTVRFIVDLPLTLNQRDPIGLILLQNQEVSVNITIDIDQATKILDSVEGYTVALKTLNVTPFTETFSVPASPNAFPDLSVLKLVQSKKDPIAGAGLKTIDLPTGTTYRKLLLFIEDANGVGVADTSISGNIDLIFNQADIPYSISPKLLAVENQEQYGQTLPAGLYVFDFTDQGFVNYGGSRDYIDTEKLTMFQARFSAPGAGNITAIYETLSRLQTV
jgi:hypothetical protein